MGERAERWISFSKMHFLFQCKFVHNARTFSRCACRSNTCLWIRLSMCFCNLTQKHAWCCYSRIRTFTWRLNTSKNLFGIKQCLHFCVVPHLYEEHVHEPEMFSPLFLFLLKHSDVLWSPLSFTWFTNCVVHVSTRACHLHLYLTCKIEKCL